MMLSRMDIRRLGPLGTVFDPGRLRALIRHSEMGMVFAGALVGIASGLAVTAMSYVSE